jgi:hypothetical protein
MRTHEHRWWIFWDWVLWGPLGPCWLWYIWDDSRADSGYGPYFVSSDGPAGWPARLGNWAARLNCRRCGHPAGVWYHNAYASEPDMHCKGCGEDLG